MTEIKLPNTSEIEVNNNDALQLAGELEITNDSTYQQAGVLLKSLVGLKKEVQATFAESKDLTHKAHKAVTTAEAKHLSPIKSAESLIRPKMAEYQAKIERARQEEQRILQAEAQKKAEEERLKLAEEAEKKGEKEKAERLVNAPVQVAPVVVPKQKLEGVVYQKSWDFEITDPETLIQALAANADKYPDLIKVDTVALRKLVKALKSHLVLPGLKVYQKDTVVVR